MSERFPPLDDAAPYAALISGGSVRYRTLEPTSPPPGVHPPNSHPLNVPPAGTFIICLVASVSMGRPIINMCRCLVAMVSLTGGVLGEAFGFGELPWDVEEPDLFT